MCKIRPQRQFGHPDDPVHRRPNFVTHVGKEIALDARGLFREKLCLSKRFLHFFPLVHFDEEFRVGELQCRSSLCHPFIKVQRELDEFLFSPV